MMDAEQLTRGQLESEFSALARTMYFSRSTIASFAKEATRGQLVAVCDLIRGENATREENRRYEQDIKTLRAPAACNPVD